MDPKFLYLTANDCLIRPEFFYLLIYRFFLDLGLGWVEGHFQRVFFIICPEQTVKLVM